MATRSKLAVILHADVVGSTALVQIDERVAHERIRDAFTSASVVISEYGGQTHELRGDALLAEFQRASDAVTAALAIQALNTGKNQALSDDIRPLIRVGLAMGEVVIADNTITGPGVVMAQRLEQLADSGGVCLQGSVQESVPKRFPFEYADLGAQSLKGFDEPVRAFAVTLRSGETLPAAEADAPSEAVAPPPARRLGMTPSLAVLIIVGGLFAVWQYGTGGLDTPTNSLKPDPAASSTNGNNNAGEALPLPDKPSIAVLAFDNLSGDSSQDYFAEGIAEDIITDLSKISALFVIARNSSFAFKGQSVSVQTIARKLGVRYVLEGSVRPTGDRLRINAQLIDSTTDGHVWADRFDGEKDNPFELEERVLRGVLDAITVRLTTSEEETLGLRYTSNTEAYDLFVRARQKTFVRDRADADEARESLLRAIDLDPNFAEALGLLVQTNTILLSLDGSPRVRILREEVPGLIEKSLRLRKNVFVYQGAAWFHLFVKSDPETAEQLATEGLKLNPNHADLSVTLALAQLYLGKVDDALVSIHRAMRLNPSYPPSYRTALGKIHFAAGRYREAIPELVAESPMGQRLEPDRFVRAYLAGAHAFLGELDPARDYAQVWRSYSVWNLEMWEPYRDEALAKNLQEGLELSGINLGGQ